MSVEKRNLDDLRIDRSRWRAERRVGWRWVGLLLVLMAGGAAVWNWLRPRAAEVRVFVVQDAPGADPKILLNASGYVVARREATVSSKVTGKVVEVLIEEGQHVEKDQILARVDSSNLKASLDLAQAQLASAKSALEETQVRLHAADLELRRISGLAANHVASASDLDQATADANALRARLEQQRADVAVAERQVTVWQQQMDDTLIRAPFSGIVVAKSAQPGEMISPISAGGGFTRTGICTIVDMNSLEVEIDVNESYINRVQLGQPVEATLDAYPDWKIPCKVLAIIPTADRQKATVKVRVAFDKLDPRILPEMGVKVAFQSGQGTAPASAGIRIPKSAVRRQDGQDVVYLAHNGQVERRAVRLGASMGDQVIVTAGLGVGDKVIVKGFGRLKERDAVREKGP
jgi:RND family efflux transporter MFP subunit